MRAPVGLQKLMSDSAYLAPPLRMAGGFNHKEM
jgi:hypothetical protein